jgi:uncharacterized protein YndB with AHSA1/START domain
MTNPTTADRNSEREFVVTRTFDAPPRIVFDAWTKPELMKRWWTPKSFPIRMAACEMDVRVGGTYRLVMDVDHEGTRREMAFFGKYVEVVPAARLVWTNEESGADGTVTTVTFEEKDGRTHLVMHDLYPSKEALDEAIASGSTSCTGETFAQLDELLVPA